MKRLPSMPADSASRLAKVATALWVVSLFLPTFSTRGHPWGFLPGAFIFGLGTAFGWACKGWAVYANFPMGYAAQKLRQGQQPKVSILLMLALFATLPVFPGIPADNGITEVDGLGLGGITWLSSIALLALAATIRMFKANATNLAGQ